VVIRVFSIYFLTNYLVGFISIVFFPNIFRDVYRISNFHHVTFILYILICLVSVSKISNFIVKFKIDGKFLPSKLVIFIMILALIIYVAASVDFFFNYNSSFRHNLRFSEVGVFPKFLFVFKPYFDFLLLILALYKSSGRRSGVVTNIFFMIVLICNIITINSSSHIIEVALYFVVIFAPNVLNMPIKWNFKMVLLLPVTLMLALLVLYIGVSNKVDMDFDIRLIIEYIFKNLNELIARVSTSVASVYVAIDNWFAQGYDYNGWDPVVWTMKNRLSYFSSFDNSQWLTLERLNYLNIYRDYHERAGATPGLFASPFYFLLLPGVLVVGVLFGLIFRGLNLYISRITKVNFLLKVTIFFLIYPFFESPFSVFYILDPIGILYFLSLFSLSFFKFNKIFEI
jgi:hypothetical protein